MLTYRSFTESITLLEYLISRYKVGVGSHKEEDGVECVRVIMILKNWMDDHSYDFEDSELSDGVIRFCEELEALNRKGSTAHANTILNTIKKKGKIQSGLPVGKLSVCNPTFLINEPLNWTDDEIQFLAEQITLWNMESYVRITPQEMIHHVKVSNISFF